MTFNRVFQPQEKSSGRHVCSTTMDKESRRVLVLCPGDYTIIEWVYHCTTIGQNALVFIILEGGYSHKGWVPPLCWHQNTRVQTAHTNIKQRFTTCSDELVALELQYGTKAFQH